MCGCRLPLDRGGSARTRRLRTAASTTGTTRWSRGPRRRLPFGVAQRDPASATGPSKSRPERSRARRRRSFADLALEPSRAGRPCSGRTRGSSRRPILGTPGAGSRAHGAPGRPARARASRARSRRRTSSRGNGEALREIRAPHERTHRPRRVCDREAARVDALRIDADLTQCLDDEAVRASRIEHTPHGEEAPQQIRAATSAFDVAARVPLVSRQSAT